MPGSTTTLGLPYPLLGDAADIEQAVRPLADALDLLIPSAPQKAALAGTSGVIGDTNRFVTDQDLITRINDAMPIATLMPYAGATLPPAIGGVQRWAWADGSLIDRTVYTAFFSRVGHAYNGGVDPGGTPAKVKLPDKRGRVPAGADNFGAGAANRLLTHAARVNAAAILRGAGGGEDYHTLAALEGSVNGNGTTNAPDINHTHGVTSGFSTNHVHGYTHTAQVVAGVAGQAGGAQVVRAGYEDAFNTGGANVDHSHNTGWMDRSNTHAHTLNSQGANNSHINLQPFELDFYIVRIA
jgi:microcystin-dependent protein